MDILDEMMNRYKTNPFKPGDIVYFYYDNMIICQKGKIVNLIKDNKSQVCYKIQWIEKFQGKEYESVISHIPAKKVFENRAFCLAYAERVSDQNKEKIRSKIHTEEDLLKYMYDCIGNEYYDYFDEKAVIREKCKELFGIGLIGGR